MANGSEQPLTPRQQEARTLRDQGLKQHEIGERMGIYQPAVSALLSLNRKKYLSNARYAKTLKGRKSHNRAVQKRRRKQSVRSRAPRTAGSAGR